MKYGTEKMEIIIPTGTFARNFNPDPNAFATTTIIDETAPVVGIKTLESVPTIFLAICGPINPRKKKFPPKATTPDEITTDIAAKKKNFFSIFTPSAFAVS